MPRARSLPAYVTAFVVALVVSLAGPLAAQNPDQTPAARFSALLADGQKAYTEQRWDAAGAAFQAMVDLATTQHDDLWKARGLLGVGRVAMRLAKYTDAKTALLEAASLGRAVNGYQELGMIEQSLGSVAELTSEPPDTALAHYRQSAAAFESAGNRAMKASAAFNILRTDRDRSNFEQRVTDLINETIALNDYGLEGSVLHLWGDVLYGSGSYEGAIEKLDQAVAALEKVPPGQELATTYTSLGRIYRLHGQMNVALQYQLKSLDIAQKGGLRSVIAQSLNAVAVTYSSLGDVKNAKLYYERALALADSVSPVMRAFLRANYGAFLGQSAGEPERGRDLLVQALPDATGPQLTNRYAEIASIDLALHHVDQAKSGVDRALEQCAGALAPFDCIRARLLRAQIDLAQGDERAALADHDIAMRDLEDVHAQLAGEDFLKQGFEALWAPAYSLGIELHTRHGETREALDLAERARSRALLDLLASRDSSPTPLTTTPVALTTRGPRGATLRSDATADSATTDQLTSMAARLHSTFVLYWVADDRIYEWVIAPNGALSSASVAVPRRKLEDLIQASSAFADEAASHGPTARTRGDQSISLVLKPRGAWRELYDLLILPIDHHLPVTVGSRVTIVPHGPLINVPFAALKDGQGRYLVERYAVHSLTAGAMLDYTRNRTNGRTGSMLLVADPAAVPKIPGEPPLPRLPGAEAEVQAIAKLVPASRTTVLDNANATEPRVLKASTNQSVLHFATHAIVRDTDPMSSFLALGRPSDGSSNGQLTAEKIYRLKLDANLVVLSACRSGEGLPTGDGIAALARAFFYAGTDSLIVSLWDIADEPTNRLLPAFYREWLKGTDKARALRAAQLQLIADLRAGRVHVATAVGDVVIPEDPAFWAGFVLIGEPN